ncbi:Gfo/Idh/MocA family protein [Salana multivorans]
MTTTPTATLPSGLPHVRWAVLGPGVIARDFMAGLQAGATGVLHAVGSRSPERAAAFAAEYGAPVSGSYEEILARDDVDAVYVATVHTTHLPLATAALAAGKAVLCEKPLTTSVADTRAMLQAAAVAGVPFLEAFKYRFGPLATALRSVLADGLLGEVTHVDAAFGGWDRQGVGRLYDPAVGGGAILDVGAYPASFAVGVATSAGAPLGIDDAENLPVTVRSAAGLIGETGVDLHTSAAIQIGSVTATLRTTVRSEVDDSVAVHGGRGSLLVPDVWGSRTASGDRYQLRRAGHEVEDVSVGVVQPMAAEADAIATALASGSTEVPEMTWGESLLTARVLEAWRKALTA